MRFVSAAIFWICLAIAMQGQSHALTFKNDGSIVQNDGAIALC